MSDDILIRSFMRDRLWATPPFINKLKEIFFKPQEPQVVICQGVTLEHAERPSSLRNATKITRLFVFFCNKNG